MQAYDAALQTYDPVLHTYDPVLQTYDPVLQTYDPVLQTRAPIGHDQLVESAPGEGEQLQIVARSAIHATRNMPHI